MLKSCKYCGRIHEGTFDCGKKPKIKNKNTVNDRFRRSTVWTEKSLLIRRRDRFLCQCCLHNMPGTVRQIEYDNIEAHHIEPLSQAWDRRLDEDNLISLCRRHHEMAEAGEISKATLHAMAMGQEPDVGGIPRGVVRNFDTISKTDAPPQNTRNLRNENLHRKKVTEWEDRQNQPG